MKFFILLDSIFDGSTTYDIIYSIDIAFLIIVDSADLKESAAKILDRIQKIKGVAKTRTFIGAEL